MITRRYEEACRNSGFLKPTSSRTIGIEIKSKKLIAKARINKENLIKI